MSTHNNIEPSWLPQAPATLYKMGFSACELFATNLTEKSELIKLTINNKKDIANKVKSRLSSLSNNLVYPARTGLVEILLAIKPRLRQNADIKRKCPNSLIMIDKSIKAYLQKSNLILFNYFLTFSKKDLWYFLFKSSANSRSFLST